MSRYIDADKLAEYADNQTFGVINKYDIADFPAANVQEVKHGKWDKGKTDRQYCSICHEVRPYYFKETPENKGIYLTNWECYYCPNCGAKMDRGKDETN